MKLAGQRAWAVSDWTGRTPCQPISRRLASKPSRDLVKFPDNEIGLKIRVVVFIPSSGSQGFELPYPSLTLHALTPASGDQEAHLYCQIDDSDAGPTASSATAGTADIRVESNGQQNGQGNGNEMDQDGNGNDDEDDGGEYENEGEYDEMKELKVFVGEGKCEWIRAVSSA